MKTDPTPLSAIHLNDGTHGLPKNPRFIRDDRFRALCDSIRDNPEYMPARPIIVDEADVILGGNMRYRACRELKIDPLPAGWVQRVTGWSVEKKRRFIIMDNRGFGQDDMDMLANDWDISELIAAGFTDIELSGADFGDDKTDDTYTNKIVAPVYTPKGDAPPIATLIDRRKTDLLQAEISAAALPSDIAQFLKEASERHTVFHFGRIAEFYCHASPTVQGLMEKSGMVIIDFKKAIEYGFVHLTERLGALADQEESDVDA